MPSEMSNSNERYFLMKKHCYGLYWWLLWFYNIDYKLMLQFIRLPYHFIYLPIHFTFTSVFTLETLLQFSRDKYDSAFINDRVGGIILILTFKLALTLIVICNILYFLEINELNSTWVQLQQIASTTNSAIQQYCSYNKWVQYNKFCILDLINNWF